MRAGSASRSDAGLLHREGGRARDQTGTARLLHQALRLAIAVGSLLVLGTRRARTEALITI
jgi:hypothetical protein